MIYILETLASFVINTIETTGYAGITILMALESANIPIPSEIIMPFSGFLVWQGTLQFWPVVIWGAIGNLIGSLVSYYLGYFGGRPFFKKYGCFIFVTEHDVALAEKLFDKYGAIAIFVSKLLPIVRTFASFPAGLARMDILKFSIYSFIGSVIWSYFLTYVGFTAGENWDILKTYFHKFDWVIAALIIAAAIYWIWRHIVNNRNE